MKEDKFISWIKKAYSILATWCYKYIGGLFLEDKNGKLVISIGRTMLLLVFVIMVWFWLFKGAGKEMPGMLFEAFVTLCGYVLGSKVASLVSGMRSKIFGSSRDKPSPEGP